MTFIPAPDIFHAHLEDLLDKERTYKRLSLRLGVSESCLKSWLAKQRTPGLRSIDKLANHIGYLTCQLLRPEPLTIKSAGTNNSHIALCRNLRVIFIERQCFSIPQKLALLNNQVSDFALSSYLRCDNYRLPTLRKLDSIAQALGIEAYKLLLSEA